MEATQKYELCVSFKSYIENITKSGVMPNKTFWRTVRPFLTNKGILMDNEISLIHDGKTIYDEKQIAKAINHAYNNILGHITGNKPTGILNDTKRARRAPVAPTDKSGNDKCI